MNAAVTCVIPATRYVTTLPLTVQSILCGTVVPSQLLIFQDGGDFDFNTHPLWKYIATLCNNKGVEISVIRTSGIGMVKIWQQANITAKYPLIWRVDDDMVVEPNVLQLLLETGQRTGAAGIAPQVMGPGNLVSCPPWADGKMRITSFCPQNFLNPEPKEVEFFVSTYIYNKQFNWYPIELSKLAHTEDMQHSHEIFRNGGKLVLDNRAQVWHYSYPEGGCREMKDKEGVMGELRKHDNEVWAKYCTERNIPPLEELEILPVGHGLGDAIVFRNNLDNILPYYKKPVWIGTQHPQVFEGIADVRVCSPSDCLTVGLDISQISIYTWMEQSKWKGTIGDAYISMFTGGREKV